MRGCSHTYWGKQIHLLHRLTFMTDPLVSSQSNLFLSSFFTCLSDFSFHTSPTRAHTEEHHDSLSSSFSISTVYASYQKQNIWATTWSIINPTWHPAFMSFCANLTRQHFVGTSRCNNTSQWFMQQTVFWQYDIKTLWNLSKTAKLRRQTFTWCMLSSQTWHAPQAAAAIVSRWMQTFTKPAVRCRHSLHTCIIVSDVSKLFFTACHRFYLSETQNDFLYWKVQISFWTWALKQR